MKLIEAIKINKTYLETYEKGMLSWEKDAQKLGIEALERFQNRREYPNYSDWSILPGETEGIKNETQ